MDENFIVVLNDMMSQEYRYNPQQAINTHDRSEPMSHE